MTVEQKLKILAITLNISVSEMARQTGDSPQNFNQKMKRGTFTLEELEEIAEKLECRFESNFVLPNGEKI